MFLSSHTFHRSWCHSDWVCQCIVLSKGEYVKSIWMPFHSTCLITEYSAICCSGVHGWVDYFCKPGVGGMMRTKVYVNDLIFWGRDARLHQSSLAKRVISQPVMCQLGKWFWCLSLGCVVWWLYFRLRALPAQKYEWKVFSSNFLNNILLAVCRSPFPPGNNGQCGTYWLQLLLLALFLVFSNRQHFYGLNLPLIHKEL